MKLDKNITDRLNRSAGWIQSLVARLLAEITALQAKLQVVRAAAAQGNELLVEVAPTLSSGTTAVVRGWTYDLLNQSVTRSWTNGFMSGPTHDPRNPGNSYPTCLYRSELEASLALYNATYNANLQVLARLASDIHDLSSQTAE